MKNLARCLVCLLFINTMNGSFADEWIPYQHQYVIQNQPVVIPPQPVVVYQWVPYTVQQSYIVNQPCLFRVKQNIITIPVTQWVVQPVVIYR